MWRTGARWTMVGLMAGVLALSVDAFAPATSGVAFAADLAAAQGSTVNRKVTCRVMGPEEWYLVTGLTSEYGGTLCVR